MVSIEDKNCVLECGTSLAEQEYAEKPEEKAHVSSQHAAVASARGTGSFSLATAADVKELREILARDVVTQHPTVTTFISPIEDPSCTDPNHHKFLRLPLVYVDQTASNRPVRSIEEYLQRVCLPLYGNTHTNTSITGSQSTALVAEARQMVAEACNAKITGKASLDAVLFTGQGATSAVQLLIDGLGIRHAEKQPIVFCGPYEHHSNLIPWREAGCRMVMIPEGLDGTVDLGALERQLTRYQAEDDCLKMGTFCAASNVTGKLSDTNAIATLLHKYGALAFFDYATAAPYIDIDMNPPPTQSEDAASVAKDAIFISPHKCFGGGAGTPGILVCKKRLLSQVNPPLRSGGGTVFYVTHSDHRFLSNRLERYEGGTPHVVGIWRTGLVMRLKKEVELLYGRIARNPSSSPSTLPSNLKDFECYTYRDVAAYWRENAPNLVLLGDDDTPHLPIFSFLIRCGERFLHYNYVSAILNDLFGIQSRGGCQCAGPYSQRLLGLTTLSPSGDQEIPSAVNRRLEEALVKYKERAELLRPGYTRLSLPFKGLREEEVDYIMRAVAWVAENAWALMCQYRCNHRTGEWRHCSRQGKPLGREERRWLSHYLSASDPIPTSEKDPASIKILLEQAMANADNVLMAAKLDQKNIKQSLKMTKAAAVLDDLEGLRWYVYPQECAQLLASQVQPDCSLPLQGPLDLSRKVVPIQSDKLASSEGAKTTEALETDRKRKIEESTTSVSNMPVGIFLGGNVRFRDGGVNGTASLTEIDQRMKNGDLSGNCEVLNQESGKWIGIGALFGTKKSKTANDSSISEVSMTKVNFTKKETRDSNSWGMGSVVPPKLSQSKDAPNNSLPAVDKKQKTKHKKPPAKMMRLINQAIFNWDMIENGDRLLLGLSGGKDSLSLLHCILEFRRKMPINFEIEVCTIDPMTPSFDPSPLIPYVESIGLKYHYIRDDIVARANSAGKDGKTVSSLCAFCARMKRGNLYSVARKNKCNKLVLAQVCMECASNVWTRLKYPSPLTLLHLQHLDDCAESFMMSVMHNGFLRTMKAHYIINEGDLAVIRPMVYCRESLMADFAKSASLPVINENCPACFEEPKERARVKKLLSREELNYPNFYDNIRRALIPLMHGDMEPIMHGYTEDVVAKARKRLVPQQKLENAERNGEEKTDSDSTVSSPSALLADATDEDLIRELARRKADRHRLSGSHKRLDDAVTDESASAIAAKAVCTVDGACSFFD